MTLRNAFEDLSTEETLMQILLFMQRNMRTYARTIDETMRVTVNNAPQAVIYPANTSTTPYQDKTWYAVSSSFMVDEREKSKQASMANFYNARSRWSIT